MFKVIVAVLILSDTGSATTAIHSIDMNAPEACERLARNITYEASKDALGRRWIIRSKGRCEPDGPALEVAAPVRQPNPFDILFQGLR